jgi:hypothetical protein
MSADPIDTIVPIDAEPLTTEQAERLTLKIDLKLGIIADNRDAVLSLIREAITREAYKALGYASNGAYMQDRFGAALSRLGIDARRDVVLELTEVGMSTRAIASVVGVSNKTVHQDQRSLVSGQQSPVTQVTPDDDSQAEQPSAPLAKVIGIDGKAYNQQQPKQQPKQQPRRIPRRPLLDAFLDAVAIDLQKLVVRIDKLATDDRVARDIDKVASYADLIDQYADELKKSADKIRNINEQGRGDK